MLNIDLVKNQKNYIYPGLLFFQLLEEWSLNQDIIFQKENNLGK